MIRARAITLLCLTLSLALASVAPAQPKIVLTQVSSDLSRDGNTVVGTILDANVYARFVAFTQGSGFQVLGPVARGFDGSLKISDINAGSFFMESGIYNGYFGTNYWPPSNPGLFGNYSGTRACCNGTTCTVMDMSQCLAPGYSSLNTASCSPNPCAATPPVSGGCCNASTNVCTYISQAACTAPNYWLGGNLACGNYPCAHGHTIPYRFSSATNSWSNLGSFPNNTGGAGQGAAVCDGTISTPYAISSNGRFVVGGADYGAYGTVSCSVRGFIADANDLSVQMLPLIGTGAGCQNFSQAWAVATDGSIVLGRDTHASTTPTGALISCNATCLTVWERDPSSGQYFLTRPVRACCTGTACVLADPATCTGTSIALASTSCTPQPCPPSPNPPTSGACCNGQSMNCSVTTQGACGGGNFWIGNGGCSPRNPCLPATEIVLDEYGAGSLNGAVMTRSGTIVAAPVSSGTADYVLSDSSQNGALCRYVRNAGTGQWQRTVLGFVSGATAGDTMTPRGISDDGNTIVGVSNSGRSFIWKPSLNGGVPMELNAYVQSINGGQAYPPGGGLGVLNAISGDGNAVLVSCPQSAIECPAGTGLANLARAGILHFNGAAVACQAPVIAGGPYDVLEREYTRFGMVGNVFAAGSYPMTAQWQRESPPFSNNWVNIDDSCGGFTMDNTWTYEGTHGFQLRVNELADASVRDGRYRVVITNSCGSATSQVANFSTLSGACCWYDSGSDSIVCTVEIQTRCGSTPPFGVAGVYLGDGVACSPTACGTGAIGACCWYAGGVQCVADVSTHCANALADGGRAGSFAGVGTSCTPIVCATVSGACCYSPDGVSSAVCTFELGSHCTTSVALGGIAGVYAGNATTCSAGGTCPAGTVGIGACCFNVTATSDIMCAVQSAAHCTGTYLNNGLQGKYQGDGITCGASTCRPATFGLGSSIGACCFTDPGNPASGPLCLITYSPNCSNYPNGSNDANAAPFNTGLGGNFYTNTCCGPSSTPPISGCSTTANCAATLGACIHTPFDNTSPAICTLQVRASRCTRRYNAGGLFGTWVPTSAVCSPAVLAANSGACCFQPVDFLSGAPTGCVMCMIQPHDRCVTVSNGGMGGVYGGDGTTCSPTAQCPAQYGACCTGSTCAVTARSACTGASYSYPAQSCGAVACQAISVQPPPTAACCNTTTLACTVTTQAGCPAPASWLYTGTCGTVNPCAQPASGACCIFNSCIVTCTYDCVNNAGDYRGDGSVCSPDPCAPTGVCCRGSTCSSVAPASCTVASGLAGAHFVGAGACSASATSPCCHADYNKVNGISVQDIFDFLADWFAGSRYAIVGGDGSTGTLSVQNIFDFLGVWFAGGC